MKKFNLKVEKSSDYWTDFESELSVYYHLKWFSNSVGIQKFILNEISFISEYNLLTHRYGLVIPIQFDEQNFMADYEDYKAMIEKNNLNGSNFINYLYNPNHGVNLIYPSKIFTGANDESPKVLIGVDPILEFENSTSNFGFGNAPLRVELWKKESQTELTLSIDNDIFNLCVDKKKQKKS